MGSPTPDESARSTSDRPSRVPNRQSPPLPSTAGQPDLADVNPAPAFLSEVALATALEQRVLGIHGSDGMPEVLLADPTGLPYAVNVARRVFGTARYRIVDPERLRHATQRAYQQQASRTDAVIGVLDRQTILQRLASREDLLDVEGRAPVVQLVNLALLDAVRDGASDVHLQPYEDRVVIRFRIDGVLFDQFVVPKGVQDELISRVKVLARMDVAERRLPQDGRASVQIGDRAVDLRIASLPTSHGERVVIRLLDKSQQLHSLTDIGMDDRTLAMFRRLARREHGLLLVTGPTGSGKSTTLYSVLQEIDSKVRNIVTLEDPIEFQLEGISQTQVSEKKGLTFAKGLRNVLRQDPDIIMVGEIRDRETAEMAIQSALTGHLVLSTLHTNDAASAVTRLLDLGIEPFLAASSLVAVLAQRLVRRRCGACRGPGDADSESGRPCTNCRGTGYRGRIGIFELLVLDDRIRSLVGRREDASVIRSAAVGNGMRLLREDGMSKTEQGLTTREEVLRVAMEGIEEL